MCQIDARHWAAMLGIVFAMAMPGCGESKPEDVVTLPESVATPPEEDEAPAAEPIVSFTDHVPYPNERVAFEMVRVPGSADGTIKPLYIGRTEVTWQMFRGWSYGIDLTSTEQVKRELDQGLRPSELYADRPNAQMGFGQRPAIGMTRENAEAFCSWLSKKTSRTYRLPTDAEWSHVLKLSGGIPDQGELLLNQAVLSENALLDQLGNSLTLDVASKQPNRLGLYDLLGNAAEWVQPEGGSSWVRGGHFQLEVEQLSADWRATEDREVWNASSPKLPNDTWWYVDHYYQGFRLVCEEGAEEKPKPETTGLTPIETTPSLDDLPKSFTDEVQSYNKKKVPFEMVLIPGNKEQNIKPFYVAKTEVTWGMFEYWIYGGDTDWKSYIDEMGRGIRPSSLGHGHPQTDLGLINEKQQPAIGMSWRVAQAYCRWLSEQTGRSYRLPTDNEWRYLLEQSGGVPVDRQSLLDHSLFLDNADWDELELFTKPRNVGQGKPDKLGLYDLIGNAAEWVQPMGGKRWVRGGHFAMEAKDFNADWLAVEDQAVWNEDYPNFPVSKSWYLAHYYQGIRLVCAIEVPVDEVRSKP